MTATSNKIEFVLMFIIVRPYGGVKYCDMSSLEREEGASLLAPYVTMYKLHNYRIVLERSAFRKFLLAFRKYFRYVVIEITGDTRLGKKLGASKSDLKTTISRKPKSRHVIIVFIIVEIIP